MKLYNHQNTLLTMKKCDTLYENTTNNTMKQLLQTLTKTKLVNDLNKQF